MDGGCCDDVDGVIDVGCDYDTVGYDDDVNGHDSNDFVDYESWN